MEDKDREELVDELQEYFQEVVGEAVGDEVEEAYEDLLEKNLDHQLDEVPEQVRDELAEVGAALYAHQTRKILRSDYLGDEELDLAMATAFLDDGNEILLAKKTRAVFREYEDQLSGLDRETYEERALTVLNHPWPESDLGTGVERFKDPDDDPTFH
ncbi:hypothetical protein ACK3SF_05690 [Candidatus Nanosalina sp. VS9-1]|uniref:hypothetical protein n=1 Tax=Candidatus Nanosalina sp. VS9-1 TaxID=3388566 RepID=UPI0039DFD593